MSQVEERRLTLSTVDLAQARTAVASLLEQLGLEAYLFEVEPCNGAWEVRVECATAAKEWQSVVFPVDRGQLGASITDETLRRKLLAEWAGHLAACKRSQPVSGQRIDP